MATKKLTLAQRAKKDPKLLKRARADPGLRSKLPTSMLNPEQRRTRELNVRLKQPITPGSTTTERDLARESSSAMDVKYGPLQQQQQTALGQEQARGRDLGGWYDQYLAAVAQHARNVQGIGAQAGQIGLGLQQGVTGLGQAGLAMVQNPANADAAARGATAGNLAPMENQALAVRQALTGSFVAQQAAQNAATQSFADTTANVVAPGEKLGAMVQQAGQAKLAQDKITQTARDRGADETVYRADRRSDEAKQILAQQTLTGNLLDKQADNTIATNTLKETKRAHQADESEAGKRRRAQERKARRDAAAGRTAEGAKMYTSGAFSGKTHAEVNALTPQARQQLVDKFNRSSGSSKEPAPGTKYREDFFKKYNVYPATTSEANKAKDDIKRAGEWLRRITRNGKIDLGAAGRILTTGQPAGETTKDGKKKKTQPIPSYSAVLIRAAMDQMQNNGTISPATADRLHRAGFSVPGLGLQTGSAPAHPAPKPTLNTGGSLGGFPKKK
jgi:hypothetical protein